MPKVMDDRGSYLFFSFISEENFPSVILHFARCNFLLHNLLAFLSFHYPGMKLRCSILRSRPFNF